MAKTPKGDTIAILYPFDQVRECRNNAHSGKSYGRSKDHDVAYAHHKWFQVEQLTFTDVRTMNDALVAIAAGGRGIPVRGQRADYTSTSVRRIMAPEGDDSSSNCERVALLITSHRDLSRKCHMLWISWQPSTACSDFRLPSDSIVDSRAV